MDKLSDQEFFAAHDGKNTGITVKKSLFYTDYNFDLLFEGSQNGGGAGAFASNITFTYQMTLPSAPSSTNADREEDGGRTLTWNLGKTLVTGDSGVVPHLAYERHHRRRRPRARHPRCDCLPDLASPQGI